MRYRIGIAAALVCAGMQVTAAAAQVEVQPQTLAAAAPAPLPASLVPDKAPEAGQARTRISGRRFLVSVGIGTVAGAGAGLLIGAITTDGCQPGEDWCILSWEEEVAIHGVAGAMVGAGIGAVYGLVSGSRQPRTQPAPVTLAPAAAGGMSLGLTLRH